MLFIGIDPGLHGAIAILAPDGTATVIDTPVFETAKSRSSSRSPDYGGIVNVLRPYATANVKLYIEAVHGSPAFGAVQNFKLGQSDGAWRAALASLRIPYEEVAPQTWKKRLGLSKDKAESLALASRLYPSVEGLNITHHDRCEALLIAHYAFELTDVPKEAERHWDGVIEKMEQDMEKSRLILGQLLDLRID